MTLTHLIWIPLVALVGFLASFVFGDLLKLPLDLYYLIYFAIITGLFVAHVRSCAIDVGRMAFHRIGWAVLLGIVVGVLMVINVIGRPETERFSGGMLVWAILWRGVVYGAADGLLLFTFPWMVAWRAFGAGTASARRKTLASIVAFASILFITTTYHLGYADFRSSKILQPNIGSTIVAIPTLLTANPVASPISHVFLHVAAVLHSPYTDLFLPPHREPEPSPTPTRLPERDAGIGGGR